MRLMVTSIINYWDTTVSFFTGGMNMPFNIWTDLSLAAWITFGLTLLPAYEFFGIAFDKDPAEKLDKRLSFYSKLFNGMLKFISWAVTFMKVIIAAIRQVLPI